MKKLITVVFAVSMVSGCMVSRNQEPAGPVETGRTIGGDVVVIDGYLSGEIGDVYPNGEAEVTGRHRSFFTDVTVLLQNSREASMVNLTFHGTGGIEHEILKVGTSHTFDSWTTGDLDVTGLACSGSSTYNWDYDAEIQALQLDIEPTSQPDVDRFHFEAEHYDGMVAYGSVDVYRPQ